MIKLYVINVFVDTAYMNRKMFCEMIKFCNFVWNITSIHWRIFVEHQTILFNIFNLLLERKDLKMCINAFWQNDTLVEFSIPPFITRIELHAFLEYTSLTKVTIPSSVVNIESYTFDQSKSLKEVKIHSSLTSLEFGCYDFQFICL